MGSTIGVDELLAPFWADPGASGIFSDFDGTLAAIVDDPSAALPLPTAVDLLAGLARRYRRVGVISGRPAAFLVDHLGGRGLLLSGLYGLEAAAEGQAVRALPEADEWRPVVDEVAGRAELALAPGVAVERKGLSVTVHYRTDPSQEAAAAAWARREAAATGLALHPARMSYELRPPIERDKGTVLAEAADGCAQACFLGDDRGDLAAFDALDRLAAAGTTALRVAVASAEAPEELLDRADLVVAGPDGVLSLLRRLLDGPPA